MTITTLILYILLATGILAVTAVDGCPSVKPNINITSCCKLGSRFFTFGRNVGTKSLSGVYLLNKFCGDDCVQAEAYCDTSNEGGGWLVVQRRQDGSVDFNRTWAEYEDGFGELTGEFWYGLKALHCLTGQGGWEMRMDIKLDDGTNVFFHYEQFIVASAEDKYNLTVGGFQGTTNDSMAVHNGMNFTTIDNDNDQWSRGNCALLDGRDKPSGGWWYKSCWGDGTAPNYSYTLKPVVYFNGRGRFVPYIEIKIRPRNCNI